MKKRSLSELDQVIKEILERNPDFLDKLEDIIKNNKDMSEERSDRNERH
jgi:hypothetical protein